MGLEPDRIARVLATGQPDLWVREAADPARADLVIATIHEGAGDITVRAAPDGMEPDALVTLVEGSRLYNSALDLPGAAGSYASTPDLARPGDMDDRILVAFDVWPPASLTSVMGQFGAAPQRSWMWRMATTTGLFSVAISTTGSNSDTSTSTAAPTVVVGEPIWLRRTLDIDNGAGNRVYTFYQATVENPDSWQQVGAVVLRALTGAAFNSTAPIELGANTGGTVSPLAGRIFAAELRNGIGGTVIASPDFRPLAPGTTSFEDEQGNVWTVHGAAVVVSV